MTLAEYWKIIEENLNWLKADIYRLAYECFLKKLTENECLEVIAEFKTTGL